MLSIDVYFQIREVTLILQWLQTTNSKSVLSGKHFKLFLAKQVSRKKSLECQNELPAFNDYLKIIFAEVFRPRIVMELHNLLDLLVHHSQLRKGLNLCVLEELCTQINQLSPSKDLQLSFSPTSRTHI